MVTMLMDYTGHIDVLDREGRSPAHVAAFNGEVECLDVLIGRGKDYLVHSFRVNRRQPGLAYRYRPI